MVFASFWIYFGLLPYKAPRYFVMVAPLLVGAAAVAVELLKCLGDQTAASLLNFQLSERLSQARELEAFQVMSAFFVHDLKNTASTLNLIRITSYNVCYTKLLRSRPKATTPRSVTKAALPPT